MSISVTLSDVTAAAKQQLSIIGKHHKTASGETLFSTATLSSLEESAMPTLAQSAAHIVVAELSPIITSFTGGEHLSFRIDNDRWNNGLNSAFSAALQSYLIASTVQSVINMFAPDIAPKYTADAQQLLASLVKMAFTKQQPSSSSAAFNVSATATLEDSEKTDGYSN
jgi:hypothetical protein